MKAKRKRKAADDLLPVMFAFGRILRGEMAKNLAPLSLLHYETLKFVADAGAPSMRDVALYLKVSAPSATELINGLVRGRCLARVSDPDDRRKVRLTVSATGTRTMKRAEAAKVKAFSKVIAPLSVKEREALIKILTSVINH